MLTVTGGLRQRTTKPGIGRQDRNPTRRIAHARQHTHVTYTLDRGQRAAMTAKVTRTWPRR